MIALSVIALLLNFVQGFMNTCVQNNSRRVIYKQRYLITLDVCWYDYTLTQGHVELGYSSNPNGLNAGGSFVYTPISQCLINHNGTYTLPATCDHIAQSIGTYFGLQYERVQRWNFFRFNAKGDLYRISLPTRNGFMPAMEITQKV
jgi:hypothetical protein